MYCKIGWKQLEFFFTGRDSKESEHIQISGIDVVGGRITGCRSHPTECRTVGRTGRDCVECWVTENMNVEIPGKLYIGH